MAKFKVGDIVDWSDAIRGKLEHLHQGPFVIKSLQGRYWRIYGFRTKIGSHGTFGDNYYLVIEAEIKHNVFLTAAKEAVERG